MNLNHIKLFRVVGQHLNLTSASALLHVSQSSISHQLGTLQKECGRKLYKRHSRGIQLTKEGQQFFDEAEPLLKQFERFEQRFGSARSRQDCEPLQVAGSYGLSAGLLPSVLADFQKSHPEVQLSVRTGGQTAIENLVLNGEVEMALVTLPGSHAAWVAVEPYREERLAAFVPAHHPLARKRRVTVAELLKTPLVLRGGSDPQSILKKMLRELEDKGFRPKVAAFYESPDAVKVAVRKGTGVGFLYEELIRRDAQNGEFKVLKVKELTLSSRIFVVYHRNRPLSVNARLFLDFLRRGKLKP